jgi:putative ABC transport system permease protein
MSFWRQLSSGVRSLWNGAAADRQVDAEVQHFMDEAAAAFEAEGMSSADARRAARQRVGSALAVREEVRASGWEHAVETVTADVRYGVRRLTRHAGFTAVTVATLGLGIGSATAMLSLAGPVLVQTLPYPNAGRIRAIWDRMADGGRADFTFGSLVELQQRSRSFESWAASNNWQPTLTGFSTAERLEGQGVTADYFRVFGLLPRIGRDFTAADDVPQAPPVVIISDRLWRRVFDAAPDVTGRQVALDGYGYEVIGVMPAAFEHRLMPAIDVWRAMQYDRTLPTRQGREWGHHLRVVARLGDGVTDRAAAEELAQISRTPIPQIARPPWASLANGVIVDSLHGDLTRAVRPAMLAVLAAATILLLIACVNVVNLLLGRDSQRRPELAMRIALGAGRWRIARQLLTETLLLALLGGVAGLFVADACIRGLGWWAPADLHQAGSITLDTPVFLLAFIVTAIVGVAVGLVPALSRRDLIDGVPRGSWRSSASHHVTRRALVIAEVAFALVLLIGAGLLFQSRRQLFAIDPGFEERNVLAVQVQVAGRRFADAAVTRRHFEQVLAAVKDVPGVLDAALTTQLPLSGDSDVYGVRFESRDGGPGDAGGGAFRYSVSPGYFSAMGIPLRRGRLLSEHDHATAPLAGVISESLARSRFPNGDALGQRMQVGPTNRPWFTVVGIVADVKQASLETRELDAVYTTPAQWHFADRAFWLVIKSRQDAAALAPAVRSAIWSVDKEQPIVRVATLDAIVASTARVRSFALLLFEAFGFASLFLTAIGIYGIAASGVTDRFREIGVRTALGASRQAILRMVIGEGASMAAVGIVIGIAIAAAATRGLTALLFGVSRFDPLSYTAVVVVMFGVSALACWLPARRAARIDPAITLRAE